MDATDNTHSNVSSGLIILLQTNY